MNVLEEFRWREMIYDFTPGGYKISGEAIQGLQSDAIPADLINKLQALENQDVLPKDQFLDEVKKIIGEISESYQQTILGNSTEFEKVLRKQKITAYIGFDPTADSLHVGSLLPVMALARLQRFGHTPIAIVGGGTGLIGDPSGKEGERSLLTKEQVEQNLLGIKKQLQRFLDFDSKTNPAKIVNNADWLSNVSFVDFLRDVGKYFTLSYMLNKESVSRRLEQKEGISFTEFSYMLLQAYDFLVLFDRYNCMVQMGGSDQWGNITAGIELIRRTRGAGAYGLVFPLVTTATGQKFGKTEAGTVWLDPKRTSPYRFYQFWLNTDDRDVIRYLKYFTWLPEPEVEKLEEMLSAHPERRDAQRRLAREVTRLVHGKAALERAEASSRVLFGGDFSDLNSREISEVFDDVPSTQISKSRFEKQGVSILDLIVTCGLAPSKSEARRMITGGGIYLNNQRVVSGKTLVTLSDTIEGKIIILRKGQKQYHLIRLQEDS